MLNLAILLEDSVREVPERTAIVCEGTRLSYAELNAATSRVAHGLVQAGIQKGDTVALYIIAAELVKHWFYSRVNF